MSKDEYDPGSELTQEIIKTPADLGTWVPRATRITAEDKAILFPKGSKDVLVRPKDSISAINRMADEAPQPFHVAEDVDPKLTAAISRALKSLTPRQRKAVALTHMENGLSRRRKEIAAELNIRPDSLYERLTAAYKKLAKQLAEFKPNQIVGRQISKT